ncbi:aspartate/glutamate racemase family protein [Chloroflexota bacterium]
MKLLFCDPIPAFPGEPHWTWYKKIAEAVASPRTEVDFTCLKEGYFMNPTTPFTTAYNAVGMAEKAREAEKAGYDAFLVGCGHEPGLTICRALLNIPVLGPLESAAHVACFLGSKYSIIALDPSWHEVLEAQIQNYGMKDKLASIRLPQGLTFDAALSMVFGEEKDREKLTKLIKDEMEKAVDEDRAEALIAPCTLVSSVLTMNGVHSVNGAPVIDFVAAEIVTAESMVALRQAYGIGTCRKSIYFPPPQGWEEIVPIRTK